jgi:hypothetical protein
MALPAALFQAIELVHDSDRHDQMNWVFPNLKERTEVEILDLMLGLDVEGRVSHDQDARA